MPNKLEGLNKWRLEQFHINNEPGKAPGTDFVCPSPTKFGMGDNPDLVFVSDSENDSQSPTKLQVMKEVVKIADTNPSRPIRKRKAAASVVYAHVSDSSDDDDHITVDMPMKKRLTKKPKLLKALPLKSLSSKRKMAVVAPTPKPNISEALIAEEKSEHSKSLPSTPTKENQKLDLIDDLLNSPVPKTPSMSDAKHKDSNMSTPIRKDISNSQPKALNVSSGSNSELSLFEISFNHDESHDKTMKNPPPSPVEANHHSPSVGFGFDATSPVENGFSSDSSLDNAAHKKRVSKGKQPANKRKKVLPKCSKPLTDDNLKHTPAVAKVASPDVSMDITVESPNSSATPSITALSIPLSSPSATVVNGTSKPASKTDERGGQEGSSSLKSPSPNKAIVKPNSVIVIADDDEDDDVVMLTSNERNQQEFDDLEFARRLQAQFDQENTNPVPRPFMLGGGAAASSNHAVILEDDATALPESSERLLNALGGSRAVTQYLGSPSRRRTANAPVELDHVAQRIELLQQMALQQENLDDATISEILGVVAPPPDTQLARGPRPPTSVISSANTSQRQGARTRAGRDGTTSSRPATSARSAMSISRYDYYMQQILGVDTVDSGDLSMSYESLLELSERIGDSQSAGMTTDMIERLPSRVCTESDVNQMCHICMSEFELEQRIRTLTCFHEYHSECIDQWLQRNATCPICRVRVTLE